MKTTTTITITYDSESDDISVTANFGGDIKTGCDRLDVLLAGEAIRLIGDLFGAAREPRHG